MGRLEDFEDRTRGHPVANLVGAFLAIYVLGGVIMTLSGASATKAWVASLPVLLAVGSGIAAVRFRRRDKTDQ
ncbi:hypothetical protein DWB77_00360 [Streptomyces hundungensis]|uniref:Uncharacterized protein n=1 Tax=Streptomyces hundungensis TaxID=1077946 RepID=A0A387H7W9_9ACTN|nr:hypothetical protein DWB77_00360 [Streptomyces hundungensis]